MKTQIVIQPLTILGALLVELLLSIFCEFQSFDVLFYLSILRRTTLPMEWLVRLPIYTLTMSLAKKIKKKIFPIWIKDWTKKISRNISWNNLWKPFHNFVKKYFAANITKTDQ